jgi:hypothetical protein
MSVLFVAAELYVLIRELGRFMRQYPEGHEAHELSRAGQTINVNLSPSPVAGQAIRVSEGEAGQPQPQVQAATPPEGSRLAGKRTTDEGAEPEPRAGKKTGAFAVECPRCHAENSSYRVECYNCGNPL